MFVRSVFSGCGGKQLASVSLSVELGPVVLLLVDLVERVFSVAHLSAPLLSRPVLAGIDLGWLLSVQGMVVGSPFGELFLAWIELERRVLHGQMQLDLLVCWNVG